MKRQDHRLIVFCAALILSVSTLTGCVKLLPEAGPEPLRVDLTPMTVTPQAVHEKGILKVELPTCADTLNTVRVAIAYSKDNLMISDYIADVEWKDSLPYIVQQRLMQLLRGSGYFHAIGLSAEKFNAVYLLQTHLYRFEIEKKSDGIQAHVDIMATLVRREDHAVLKQQTFQIHTPITTESLTGLIQALDLSFQQFQRAILEWVKKNTN